MTDMMNFIHNREVAAGLNSGARLGVTTLCWGELTGMAVESRWMIMAIIFCCVLDFRLGCKESRIRYEEAEKDGSKTLMELYRFHRSRAVRRSLNKFVDYLILMFAFLAIGAGFLPVLGINYIYGAWAGGIIACGCELSSAGGHFLFLHGITVERRNIKGYLIAFARAVAVAVARQKVGEEAGDAVNEAFEEMKRNDRPAPGAAPHGTGRKRGGQETGQKAR